MKFNNPEVNKVAKQLTDRLSQLKNKQDILKATELKELLGKIKDQPEAERAKFGKEVNKLKQYLAGLAKSEKTSKNLEPIDVTAPFDINTPENKRPRLSTADYGSRHPITLEIKQISDIFSRMGFDVEDSREIDDEYNMFGALNFPEDHPARDDYDTFVTEEGLILPAHTSTMQNRLLKNKQLPIRAVIPGRVFRNEDVDASHEHTFHQLEGVYVDKGVNLANMLATIQEFLEAYFGQHLEYKTQPFYFPFVEPGIEYLIKVPKQLKKRADADEWLEIMGCGMIHPNVLKEGGIDPEEYSGFAFGMGIDRMVMMKLGIDDVRYFMSANLDFLGQMGVL